jgi:amino acid transporter
MYIQRLQEQIRCILLFIFLVRVLFIFFCSFVWVTGFNYIAPSYDESIYTYWPTVGIAISFVITLFCLLAIPFGNRQDWYVHKCRVTLCMMLFAFCIRQYEENIFDLLQREESFAPFANTMLDTWLPGFHCGNMQVSDSYYFSLLILLSRL